MLCRLAERMETRATTRLSRGADRHLIGFLPGIISRSKHDQRYFDNDLHSQILDAFGRRYGLVGVPADDLTPRTGYQFANDDCLESGLALALVESELGMGCMLGHGLVPHGDLRLTVSALVDRTATSGYDIARLDDKPAQDCLRDMMQDGVVKAERAVFGLPDGADFGVVVPLHLYQGPEGAIRVSRRVRLGDHFHLLDATADQMIEAGIVLLDRARAKVHAQVNDVSLGLVFSCTGRYQQYAAQGTSWRGVVDQIRKKYPGVPIVVLLCSGEFGPDPWGQPRANNMSVVACCLTNRYAARSLGRGLQERLLKAADHLSLSKTPREVMEAILGGAVEAGGTGGMVCIVDRNVRRILGKRVGYALRPPFSPHNWLAVHEVTDRPAPREPVDNSRRTSGSGVCRCAAMS